MNWLAIPTELWTALTYAGGVVAFVAGVLVVRAIHGSPAGWQPTCRRCRHDLRGVDPDKSACPECGADLARPDAVRSGRRVRRTGAVVVALIAAAVAGTTLWWLTPARVAQLRVDLVGSIPLETLVDTVLSGLREQATEDLAWSALGERLGTATGTGQRTAPSGELLRAILSALARTEERGRTPLGTLLEGRAGVLLRSLDDAERKTLLELAVEEIIAGGATKLDLARIHVAAHPLGAQADAAVAQLAERLRETEEGRAANAPRVAVGGTCVSGDIITLTVERPLDRLRKSRMRDTAERDELLLLARAEAVSDGLAPKALHHAAAAEEFAFGSPLELPSLIADLAPGRHVLRLRVVVAPRALVPVRRTPDGGLVPKITADDASKLDNAFIRDEAIAIDVVAPRAPAAAMERTTEAEAIAACAEWLEHFRVAVESSRPRIDYDALWQAAERGLPCTAQFLVSLRQDGASAVVGSLSLTNGGVGTFDAGFGGRFAPDKPFEVVLDPAAPTVNGAIADGRAARPLVWARFTLRFTDATATPAVESEPLPVVPAVATPSASAEARALIERLVKYAVTPSFRFQETRRAADRSKIVVDFGASAKPAVGAAGDAGPIVLSGSFELRCEGSLISPVRRLVVVPDFLDGSVAFPVANDLAAALPRTMRYTPDPACARAKVAASFRYVAEAFEIRFTDPATPPEVVWLGQEADAATRVLNPTDRPKDAR